MKRIMLGLTILLATSSFASAQFAQSKENLRGLRGVQVIVMFGHCPSRNLSNCAEGLDEAQRPEVLKMLEADATARLQRAGIPLLRFAGDVEKAGRPRLIVLVTLDKPNGFVHPLVTEVKLLQNVRLARDPSIETDAVTWRRYGVGAKLETRIIQQQVATEIDQFIEDYFSVNRKEAASSRKTKSQN